MRFEQLTYWLKHTNTTTSTVERSDDVLTGEVFTPNVDLLVFDEPHVDDITSTFFETQR